MKAFLRITVPLLFGIGLLAFVMAVLAGFFEEKIQPGHVTPPIEDIEGTEVTVQRAEEPILETATGTIRAREETAISARITARIVSMTARAGDSVEKDAVLVTLDDRDLQARLSQAQNASSAVRARLEEARRDLDRTRQLFNEGVNSQADLDRAEATFESLRAQLERNEQSVEEARASLSYAKIESPIEGRVIDRYAEPGDLATPGSPLMKLYDPATLRLEADVRESVAATLERGDSLRVRIDSLNVETTAEIEEIVPLSDPGSRTFVVKAALEPVGNLYPGMFGRLLIPRGTRKTTLLPERAIARVGQLEYVLVSEEIAGQNRAVRRFIRTGERKNGGLVEILSGLEPGETVIQTRP